VLFSDYERLSTAYAKARDDLLAVRAPGGHWVGELASSALATATAVSALALVQGPKSKVQGPTSGKQAVSGQLSAVSSGDQQASRWLRADSRQPNLGPGTWDLGLLIDRGINYLAVQQNADGGFGDTDLSHSNIATTMLVSAAFHLAGAAERDEYRELLSGANEYIEAKGGSPALRARYGKDKTFAVPILTNCALAGLVDWREVSPLPFELAAFPQSWYRFFRLPVVSYAIPALVAIGQARYFHRKPRNPLACALRAAMIKRTLKVLERIQP